MASHKKGLKNKSIILMGISLGVSTLVIYAFTLKALLDNPLRESIAKPFNFISYPVFTIGEAIFGQAPIFIFPILVCYWSILGIVIVFLLNYLIIRIRGI